MKHQVKLANTYRALEPQLQQLIKEVASGNVSVQMEQLATGLCRALPYHLREKAIHLFPTNWECDYQNEQDLELHQNNAGGLGSRTYKAEDSGDMSSANHHHIPKKLKLKVHFLPYAPNHLFLPDLFCEFFKYR